VLRSVKMRWNELAALHIPVRCVVHHFFLLHCHTQIFRISHPGVKRLVISISKKTIESKWFGQFRNDLRSTDVLSPRCGDTVSATADGGWNR